MGLLKEQCNVFYLQLEHGSVEIKTYVLSLCVRAIALIVILFSSQTLLAQQINIDSFYSEVSHITELEAKRKKFYQLRSEYRYSERLNRSDWKDEIIRLFEDDRFDEVSYDLIKGDLLAGAFEDLDDYRTAANLNIATAEMYKSSGLGHPGSIAIHYSFAGRDYLRIGQLDSAAYYLDKAQELNIEHDLNNWEIYINQADLYKELNDWEEVDRCYQEGYEALVARNQPRKLGYFLYLACDYYYTSGRNPELLNYFMNQLDEYQAGKPLSTAASHYPLLDFLYAPPIDTTIRRLSTALRFNRATNNIQGTNILSRTLANAYSRKKLYQNSIEVIESEIRSMPDTIAPYYGHLLYDDLQRYYKAVGNVSGAYEALLTSMDYRDQFINQRMKESTAAAQVKYETERTEKELLQKEAELSSAKQRILLFGLGGVGLLGISGLLYRSSRFRKKINSELENKNTIISKALKEKDDLLKEIHHRVKNNLQIISSLLSLQSRKSTDADTKAAIKEGRDRVRSMALIHQNLHVDKDRVSIKIEEYIPKLIEDLNRGLKPDHLDLRIDVNVEPLQMDIDDIVPIGLIINELVTNVLKYAFVGRDEGRLIVEAGTSDSRYGIVIEDNGVGYDQRDEAKGSGLGRQLVSSFCDKLDAELIINSIPSKGTKVEIWIPQNS